MSLYEKSEEGRTLWFIIEMLYDMKELTTRNKLRPFERFTKQMVDVFPESENISHS